MLTNSYIVELLCRKSLLICKINRGRWCTNRQSENGVFVRRVRYDQKEHAVPSTAMCIKRSILIRRLLMSSYLFINLHTPALCTFINVAPSLGYYLYIIVFINILN